jgi:hypothetical protein
VRARWRLICAPEKKFPGAHRHSRALFAHARLIIKWTFAPLGAVIFSFSHRHSLSRYKWHFFCFSSCIWWIGVSPSVRESISCFFLPPRHPLSLSARMSIIDKFANDVWRWVGCRAFHRHRRTIIISMRLNGAHFYNAISSQERSAEGLFPAAGCKMQRAQENAHKSCNIIRHVRCNVQTNETLFEGFI